MTDKRIFNFPTQGSASDYEETAELPIHTDIAPHVDEYATHVAAPITDLYDHETEINEPGFEQAPKYHHLSSYEKLMNMLWYQKRKDFLTVLAAVGLLIMGVSAFILLLNETPAFETAAESKRPEKSTLFIPPAAPSIAETSALPPTTRTPIRVETTTPTTESPLTTSTSLASTSTVTPLETLSSSSSPLATPKTTSASESSTSTKNEDVPSTTASPAAENPKISAKNISLDADLTKINFSGNFCASAYTLVLASGEQSLERTVSQEAEACSQSWPAYFSGLVKGQEYRLDIGVAAKETGKITYATTSFIAE